MRGVAIFPINKAFLIASNNLSAKLETYQTNYHLPHWSTTEINKDLEECTSELLSIWGLNDKQTTPKHNVSDKKNFIEEASFLKHMKVNDQELEMARNACVPE